MPELDDEISTDLDEFIKFLNVRTYNLKSRRRKRRTVLLFGRTGTGKTHQTWLMQKAGYRVFYMNLEDGDLTLEGVDLHATRVRTYERFIYLVNKIVEARRAKIVSPDTIVIDSATSFVKMVLRHLVAQNNAEKNDKAKKQENAQLQDYLTGITKIDDVFEIIGELPINFIFCAPDEYDTNDKNQRLWLPVMYKSARAAFYQYTDAVWYTLKDSKGNHILQTDGTDDVDAKIRVPVGLKKPPLYIRDPDISKIFKYWERAIEYPWDSEEDIDEQAVADIKTAKDDDW